jgi:CDP-2,3-bis-(O-geranylgeranyl)-sn-glycerol synthase
MAHDPTAGHVVQTTPYLLAQVRAKTMLAPADGKFCTRVFMFRILQLAYLMLPIYFANMAAPFAGHWRGWNRPISRRWLGSHKTVVGFALGVATAVVVTFVQSRVHWSGSLISYEHWLLLGLGCGMGALGGDSIKSFIKRWLDIPPGQSWIPADQLDFIIGGLLVLSFWARLNWLDVVSILALSFVGDVIVNHAAYSLRIRKTKW